MQKKNYFPLLLTICTKPNVLIEILYTHTLCIYIYIYIYIYEREREREGDSCILLFQ